MTQKYEIAASVLEKLQNAGAQQAQCTVSLDRTEEFNVDGGTFSLMRTLFNSSLSITAYQDGKKGSIAINSLEPHAIDEAVADCLAAAQSGVADEAYGISEQSAPERFCTGVAEPDRDALFTALEVYLETVRREYPTIIMEQLIASYSHSEELLCNTNGVSYEETGGEYQISAMFSAHEGEKSSSFCSCGAVFTDFDTPLIELGCMRAMLDATVRQVETTPVEGKFVGTMLLIPDSFTDFCQMLLGNFVCDGTLIDGTSPWKEKLGEQVADARLTLSAAPLDSRIVCGQRFTGDGYKSENYDIIKDGRLKSFMLSRYGSKKTGLSRAKNSSWNLIVNPGDKPLAQMISEIKRGILVGRFSGGQPGTNGEFSGVAKNSFLIENGKIAGAVSETMISGNLADMLLQLRDLSAETVQDGYSVFPYASFDGITVSGK